MLPKIVVKRIPLEECDSKIGNDDESIKSPKKSIASLIQENACSSLSSEMEELEEIPPRNELDIVIERKLLNPISPSRLVRDGTLRKCMSYKLRKTNSFVINRSQKAVDWGAPDSDGYSEEKASNVDNDESLRNTLQNLKNEPIQRIILKAFQKDIYQKYIKNPIMLQRIKEADDTRSVDNKPSGISLDLATPKLNRVASKQFKSKLETDCSYFAILLFLAHLREDHPLLQSLIIGLNNCSPRKYLDFEELIGQNSFILVLIHSMINLEETQIFDVLLSNVPDWEKLMDREIMDSLLIAKYSKKLSRMMKAFVHVIYKKNAPIKPPKKEKLSTEREMFLSDRELARSSTLIGKSIVKQIFANFIDLKHIYGQGIEAAQLLLDFGVSNASVLDALMSTKDEELIFQIVKRNRFMISALNSNKLCALKMFKPLLLLSHIDLLRVLETNHNFTKMLDFSIKAETIPLITSITLILVHVKHAFWNIKRYWSVYHAFWEILEIKSEDCPLIHSNNSILLCMRLYYIFGVINKKAHIQAKEIENLTKEILLYIGELIDEMSHTNLLFHLNEVDELGKNFFFYFFEINAIDLKNQFYIHQVIDMMWDQRKLAKHSLVHFMINHDIEFPNIRSIADVCRQGVGDPKPYSSSLMYCFTTYSVMVPVLSQIFWTICMAISEFYLTVLMTQFYAYGGTDYTLHEGFERNKPFVLLAFYGRFMYWIRMFTHMTRLTNKKNGQNQYFYVNYILLIMYSIHLFVIPWTMNEDIDSEREFFLVMSNTSLFLLLVIKTVILSFALPWLGVQLRIAISMLLVVLVFTFASLIFILILAFVFYAFFREYHEKGNNFGSIYNGVLVLFEFLFGSVAYLKTQPIDVYSVSQNIVLVTFSYVGNIMMANILIAFLTNRYVEISRHASFYTKKMQYQITNTYKDENHGGVFFIPLPLNFLAILGYIPMRLQRCIRLNSLLKMISHTMMIAIPFFFILACYSVLLIPYNYIGILYYLLKRSCKGWLRFLNFCGWIVLGPFILLYTGVADLARVFCLLFSYNEVDIDKYWNPEIPESVKLHYQESYNTFNGFCQHMLNIDPDKTRYKISEIILEMDIYLQKEESEKDSIAIQFNPKKERARKDISKYDYIDKVDGIDRKDELDSSQTFIEIFKQFISLSDLTGSTSTKKTYIDIKLANKVMTNKLKTNSIFQLMNFHLFQIESAKAAATFDEDADIKGEIGFVKSELQDIKKILKDLLSKQN